MTQLLVAHVKLKMIHKLVQKFDPCANRLILTNVGRNTYLCHFLIKHQLIYVVVLLTVIILRTIDLLNNRLSPYYTTSLEKYLAIQLVSKCSFVKFIRYSVYKRLRDVSCVTRPGDQISVRLPDKATDTFPTSLVFQG